MNGPDPETADEPLSTPPWRGVDEDLTPAARAYIQSLRSYADREAAREFAHMDTQSFHARMGPMLDELTQNIKRMAANPAQPFNKKAIAGMAVFGGAFADVLVQQVQNLIHHRP